MTDRCSLVSASLDEPLAGTAAVATAWLLIEDPGPWGHDALLECSIAPGVAAGIAERAAAAGVRVQMIRRAGRQSPSSSRRAVYLVHSGPGTPWVRRLELDDQDLAHLDPRPATQPSPPTLGDAVDEELLLVCTHAKHDACCALLGRPLVDAVARHAPNRTWETSHTGGHRFAGVLISLPDGHTFGRLVPGDAAALVEALAQDTIPLAHYRGRSAVAPPAQTAEVAVREATGRHGRRDVRALGHRDDGGASVVRLDVAGVPWRAVVAIRPLGTLRSLSCGGRPEDRAVHDVVGVTELAATERS